MNKSKIDKVAIEIEFENSPVKLSFSDSRLRIKLKTCGRSAIEI